MSVSLSQPPQKRVQFLLSNWINGNLSDVVNEIRSLPPEDGAIMTSLLMEQFQKRRMRSDGAVFRRIMEGRRA